ncbi:hypothetical protein Plec18167_004555 [Paecilomyces lecythidis]|uniref:Altered inheritance of mitochondria protein 9, mitochondrial n=1 Tax=Paecilomyces lecythidis TaxID=3004212 RepID=A0ABR3XR64_9EURO
MIKLAEGGFNKIFLLRMDDGYEVVARIPTPIAGPPHYTTASEVVTLRFLRNVLHVPVPEILVYSTDATNPVGAEYIILERLQGDSLASPAARRELAWISEYAKPQPRKTFLLQTDDPIDPNEHAKLLHDSMRLAPLLAPQEPELTSPILRHPDLSLANVILAPNSTEVLSIIDWQDSAILPLFAQAGYPAFCEHDMTKPQPLKQPKLPENFESMDPVEKEQTRLKFRMEEANVYYIALTGLDNPLHLKAFRLRHLGLRQYLLAQTGFQWDADLVDLKAALVGITRADSLGIDAEGGTEPENYEHAVEMNKKWRLTMLEESDDHEKDICWRIWPYKDDNDNSEPPAI